MQLANNNPKVLRYIKKTRYLNNDKTEKAWLLFRMKLLENIFQVFFKNLNFAYKD